MLFLLIKTHRLPAHCPLSKLFYFGLFKLLLDPQTYTPLISWHYLMYFKPHHHHHHQKLLGSSSMDFDGDLTLDAHQPDK